MVISSGNDGRRVQGDGIFFFWLAESGPGRQTDARWDSMESHSNSTPRGYGVMEWSGVGVELEFSLHGV